MPKPHSLIVEFSGTPGVGKSYVADRLLIELRRQGFDAHDGLRPVAATLPSRRRALAKVGVATREGVRSPVSLVRIVRSVGRSGQPPKDLIKLVQNWLVVRGLMRSARRFGGIHLFDQGIVQQLCSIGFHGDWRRCLGATVPDHGRLGPDVVVRVTAPTATNAERLRTRVSHHSRVETLHEAERVAELQRQDHELETIEDVWSSAASAAMTSPVRRISVTNDGELGEATLSELVAAITE